MRPPDRPHPRLGQPEVLHLPFLDQLLDRPGDVLDRYVRVDAVLIIEIDRLDAEPLERALGHLPYVVEPAAEPHLLAVGIELEAEFRGDDYLPAERRERLTDH